MLVYVAAPGAVADEARTLARRLAATDFVEVCSSWQDFYVPGQDERASDEELHRILQINRRELARADAIALLTADDAGRETYVELGLALATGKPVVWLPFMGGLCLSRVASSVRVVATLEDLEVELATIALRLGT